MSRRLWIWVAGIIGIVVVLWLALLAFGPGGGGGGHGPQRHAPPQQQDAPDNGRDHDPSRWEH